MHPAKLRRKRTGTICFLTVCCDGCSCRSLFMMSAASNVVYWWTTRTARECSACLLKPQTPSQMFMLSFSCSYFNITHTTWVRDNGKNWSLVTLAGFCTTVFQVTKGNWSQLGDTDINDFWDQLVSFSGFLVRQKCLISVKSTPRFKCI